LFKYIAQQIILINSVHTQLGSLMIHGYLDLVKNEETQKWWNQFNNSSS